MIKILTSKLLNGVIFGFVIATVISLISTVNIIYYINTLNDDLNTIFAKDLLGLHNIQSARVSLYNLDGEIKNFFIEKDNQNISHIFTKINENKKEYFAYLNKAKPLFYTKVGKDIFKHLEKANAEYFNLLQQKFNLPKNNNVNDEANNEPVLSYNIIKPKFDVINNNLKKLYDIKREKDVYIFNKIVSHQKIMLVISVWMLIGTIIFRIILMIKNHKQNNS